MYTCALSRPQNLDFSQQEMQWPKKRLTSLFVFELLIIWVDVISELLYLSPGDEIQPEAKRPETAWLVAWLSAAPCCLEGRTAPPHPLQPPPSPHPQSSNCAVASKILVAFGPLQEEALCERGSRLKGFDQNVCVWNVFLTFKTSRHGWCSEWLSMTFYLWLSLSISCCRCLVSYF